MKEYTPSEKSTEELREYIAKLTEESEHMTEWPDVDAVSLAASLHEGINILSAFRLCCKLGILRVLRSSPGGLLEVSGGGF